MAFLDIIVPQYKEDEKTISVLLNSIYFQKKIKLSDIGVIIINDASDVILSDSFLNKYKNLSIKYIKNEKNVGPGVSRQRGIDISKAKYITFIDADDFIYKEDSLYQIINMLKQANHNILCASMIQETMKDGELVAYPVSFNTLKTLHGLFVKRRYLIDNDIKFHPTLRYYEDTYFIQTLTHDNNYVAVNNIFYVWKYNEGSLTVNSNKTYDISVTHFEDYYISIRDIYDYYKKINLKNKEIYVLQQIVELALILNSNFFSYPELEEKKNKYEKLVYDLYMNNLDDINKLGDVKIKLIIDYQTKDVKRYYKNIELKSSFMDFINRMK